MKTSINRRRLLVGVVAIGTFAIVAVNPASADPSVSGGGSAQSGYNAIPAKVSGNVPSIGFEATSTKEFGDQVVLSGTARTLKSMSVVLSSWGCQSRHSTTGDCITTAGATFAVPLTFTVYDPANLVQPLASQTETVAVQFRPSASPECTGTDAGRWYNSKDRTCYNGFPQTVKTTFVGVTLPDQVIWSVRYNTSHYGPAPIGENADCFTTSAGCGYDSLNVGVWSFPNAPFSGIDVDEDLAFVNSTYLTPDGWTGLRPLGAIVTK